MSLNQTVDAMREVAMFRSIDPKQLRLIAFMGETLTYRSGERLFEQGDEGDAAYVIIEGEVDVLIPTERGETSVAILGPKEIFGEMAVLCDQRRSTAIAARTDLTVLRLDRTTIMRLLSEFPDISLELIRTLAHRLEDANVKIAAARA